MLTFKINSKKSYKLDKLGSSRISLLKVKVTKPKEPQFLQLGLPIYCETVFPNGKILRFPIHALTYFDNLKPSARHPETNRKMNYVINYCKYTSLIISKPVGYDIDVEFEITYEKITSALIDIYVSETIDGFSFELAPESKQEILGIFRNAKIAGKMIIGRATLNDFQTMYGTIHPYIIQSLTGLSENETKQLDYRLISANDESVIFTSAKL